MKTLLATASILALLAAPAFAQVAYNSDTGVGNNTAATVDTPSTVQGGAAVGVGLGVEADANTAFDRGAATTNTGTATGVTVNADTNTGMNVESMGEEDDDNNMSANDHLNADTGIDGKLD